MYVGMFASNAICDQKLAGKKRNKLVIFAVFFDQKFGLCGVIHTTKFRVGSVLYRSPGSFDLAVYLTPPGKFEMQKNLMIWRLLGIKINFAVATWGFHICRLPSIGNRQCKMYCTGRSLTVLYLIDQYLTVLYLHISQSCISQISISQCCISQSSISQCCISQCCISQISISQCCISQSCISQSSISQCCMSHSCISQSSISQCCIS